MRDGEAIDARSRGSKPALPGVMGGRATPICQSVRDLAKRLSGNTETCIDGTRETTESAAGLNHRQEEWSRPPEPLPAEKRDIGAAVPDGDRM